MIGIQAKPRVAILGAGIIGIIGSALSCSGRLRSYPHRPGRIRDEWSEPME